MRTCVVCRGRFPKERLLRHVCPGAGRSGLVPDPAAILPGRGFYVCDCVRCRDRFASFQGWRRKCKGVDA
jgi:predicted RNA-binding protein YlxR (DUF448 family)